MPKRNKNAAKDTVGISRKEIGQGGKAQIYLPKHPESLSLEAEQFQAFQFYIFIEKELTKVGLRSA